MGHVMWRAFSVVVAAFFLSCIADAADKPLTKDEQKAVSKYDELADPWRDKSIDAWKSAYKAAKGKTKKLFLANEPTFYPDFFALGTASQGLHGKSWGRLARESDLTGQVVGVKVFQVVSKDKMICKFGDDLFFLKGVSTKGIVDDSSYTFEGCFYVSGTEKYDTAIGGSKTIFVVEPVPKIGGQK